MHLKNTILLYLTYQVSNITDVGPAYVGTETTLGLLCPLLQTPQQNPHATIITLYLNATMEILNKGPPEDQLANMEALLKYLPQRLESLFSSPQGAGVYRIWDARSLVLDREKYFRR
jgi:hypothetical protein